ncbi:MAG: excinuclease ABC subunit UvrC [Bacillota bacterium]|nr:excinuclease ABC subunit UvrC [Bacillota bacterium]
MDLAALHQKSLELPKKPGVYIMKDITGEVIYVGKAKALKNRVTQYFQSGAAHTVKTAHMVSRVFDFDIIVTGTEFEALVLECSLIKRYRPKYNILLKDDKGYPYIRLAVKEEYPRMEVCRKPAPDGARYFGPYGGRRSAFLAIEAVCDILKLPTCRRKFPQEIKKSRPCLNRHLNRCIGVCEGNVPPEDYKKLMQQATDLLEGKLETLAAELKDCMERASENLEFEKAAALRDKLRAVGNLDLKQKVTSGAFSDLDIIAFGQGKVFGCVVVLHYIEGTLLEKEVEFFTETEGEDAPEVLSGFIKQYYGARQVSPKDVLLSAEIEDRGAVETWLTGMCGRKVGLITPQKGKKRELVLMALQNVKEELGLKESETERESKSLAMLCEALGLSEIGRVEAYDISNTAGEDTVGSMVVFDGAKPSKKDYRRFRIKTIEGQNDYGAMQEVLRRRFGEYESGGEGFSSLPSLLLIDGGLGHVTAAKAVLSELSLALPVYGMVKDDRHRTRALVSADGSSIGLSATPVLFSLVGRIQEEAHRFAISYHRTLRAKRGYTSAIDKIPGVGEARRKALLKQFGTVKKIREATASELSEAVPKNIAEKVYEYFHRTENEA